MINSMTGFGAAEGEVAGVRVSVEARCVNHRFFNPTLKVPSAVSHLESDLREILKGSIARGHVTLAIWISQDAVPGLGLDEERIAAYMNDVEALRAKLNFTGPLDIATLLRLPHVFGESRRESMPELPADELCDLARRAVGQLSEMRGSEGAELERILRDHLAQVEAALTRTRERAPLRLKSEHDRLSRTVLDLAGRAAVDPARLAQEVALLADRLDIVEELNRFEAHVVAFRKTLDDGDRGGVGKRLGFILQEMLRETNTIGSKGADSTILADVVTMKEELERLREQVENVE